MQSTSTAVRADYRFNGNKNEYLQFITALSQDLNLAGIAYILSDEEVDEKLTEPNYPDLTLEGTNKEKKREDLRLENEYKRKITKYETNLEDAKTHFQKAIGYIQLRLSPTIYKNIERRVKATAPGTWREKFWSAYNYLANRYGPKGLNDAETIKSKLRLANDTMGNEALLDLHDQIQSELMEIPRRDAKGVIQLDDDDQPITYAFDSEALRALFLDQISDDNEVFKSVVQKAILDENITYEDMMEDCRKIIDYAKNKNNQPKQKVNATQSLPQNTASVFYSATSNNTSSMHSQSNDNSNIPSTCNNCKGPHEPQNCMSNKCYKCNIVFETWEERDSHSRSEHGLRQVRGTLRNASRNTNSNAKKDNPAAKSQARKTTSNVTRERSRDNSAEPRSSSDNNNSSNNNNTSSTSSNSRNNNGGSSNNSSKVVTFQSNNNSRAAYATLVSQLSPDMRRQLRDELDQQESS